MFVILFFVNIVETQETLEAAQKAVEEKLEKLDLVEKERRQLMSEMAFQMQTKVR